MVREELVMNELLWIALPFVAALGSGVLVYIVAQAHNEAALARDRVMLIEARAQLTHQQKAMDDRVRATEAEARRQALDDFLADVRVEERHYVREIGGSSDRQKCLVLQERVCFRSIPLSQWTERELPFEGQPELDHWLPGPEPVRQPIMMPTGARPRKLLR
jgi:hypothetical protein